MVLDYIRKLGRSAHEGQLMIWETLACLFHVATLNLFAIDFAQLFVYYEFWKHVHNHKYPPFAFKFIMGSIRFMQISSLGIIAIERMPYEAFYLMVEYQTCSTFRIAVLDFLSANINIWVSSFIQCWCGSNMSAM